MDPALWSRLPDDLIAKICTMACMNRVHPQYMDDIRTQMYILDRVYYTYGSIFGFRDAWVYMYDDICVYMYLFNLGETKVLEEDSSFEDECRNLWRRLEPHHRHLVFQEREV